jgi:phosphodiesterase/alkaline phosphatase D-like protein
MWDDHDYGPNDGDRQSPSRAAAWTAYRTYAPHYPLGDREQSGPIYQAFTIGDARFILSDLRSERDPATEPDGPEKSMLGDEQRAWLERELLRSSRHSSVVFWVSSVPWIVSTVSPGDSWGAYADERLALSRFIDDNDLDNVVMLAGDAHMLAADDGTHSNYADPSSPGFPVLQAAPIDQHISTKGGPYSEGIVAEPGQFGLVTVTDDAGQVTVEFEGKNFAGETVISLRWRSPTR